MYLSAVGSASGAGGVRRDERRDGGIDDGTIEVEVEEVQVAVEAEEVDEEMHEFEVERRPAADALGGKHDVLGHHRLVQRHGLVHQHIPQPDQLGEYHWDQWHVADDAHGGSVDYSSSARAACCACPRPSSGKSVQAAPGQQSPLLHYFSTLLAYGKL